MIKVRRGATGGFQLKLVHNECFYKMPCIINGVVYRDTQVEVMASEIMNALDTPHIAQDAVSVMHNGRNYLAARSAVLPGEFLSFERLLVNLQLGTLRDVGFHMMHVENKVQFLAQVLAYGAGCPEQEALQYIRCMALVDCLVFNVDRHCGNFGLWDGKLSPVFDCGMSYFVNTEFPNFSYIEPYGEDPLDLVTMLGLQVSTTVDLHQFENLAVNDAMRKHYREVLAHVYR